VWTAFNPGDLLMFQHGEVVGRVNVPVPPCVLEKLRNPETDASASAATVTASIHPTSPREAVMLDVEAADDAAAFES
jgi:hypothetical protein